MAKISIAKIREFLSPSKHPVRLVLVIIVVFVGGFAVVGVVSIQVWQFSNSMAFCASACHDVHPEEPVAYADSYHSRVKCVECHMGRVGTLRQIVLKAGHGKHLPQVIFGTYHRPVESESMRPASESCELCHTATAPHPDSVREVMRFMPDRENTGQRSFMVLNVGGGEPGAGLESGVHWHIVNKVEFVADDHRKQDIRWVRSTAPDGTSVEFTDTAQPFSPAELDDAEIHVMDCLDCHNRKGHPFSSPETVIDSAFADGRLDRDLPFLKKEITELLGADYATQEDALEAIESFPSAYLARYAEASGKTEAVEQAADESRRLISRLVFEEPGITWRSFPDNEGHKDFPGCFRCHDGNHVSEGGEAIPLNCVTCHSAPLSVSEGGSPLLLPARRQTMPDFHRDSSWVREHRVRATDACAECHGEIKYGVDNSGFCSSSACHDSSWSRVDVDRDFTHPFTLEARHQETACYECHQGVVEVASSDCASCHVRPANHLSGACDECHQPTGFKQSASSIVARASRLPHPIGGMETCLVCHDPRGQIKPAPVNHGGYGQGQCLLCHRTSV